MQRNRSSSLDGNTTSPILESSATSKNIPSNGMFLNILNVIRPVNLFLVKLVMLALVLRQTRCPVNFI